MFSPGKIKSEPSQYSDDENSIMDHIEFEDKVLTIHSRYTSVSNMDIVEANDDLKLRKFLETINMESLLGHLEGMHFFHFAILLKL